MARKTESRSTEESGRSRGGSATRGKSGSGKSAAAGSPEPGNAATEEARTTGGAVDTAGHETALRRTGDHAPPSDSAPNPAMLKADIESGRTGDKNPVADPGMSMLGTDDEAAGTPSGPERVREARLAETGRGVSSSDQSPRLDAGHTGSRVVVVGFAIGIVLFAAIFALIVLGM